jgi:nucleoid DNA-binding protein
MGFKPGTPMAAGFGRRASWPRMSSSVRRFAFVSTTESIMAKMTKNQLIDAIAEATQVSKGDVKAVVEQMASVGYKELNEAGEFVIPGFVKMTVVNKPATEARSGVNPFTKEPMMFAAKPASKSVKASPLKVAKDAVL